MKHSNLWRLGILCLLSVLSSCSKDDEFSFKFDENGDCYYPSVQPISKDNFEKTVVGSGWKHVSTYEIDANGECLKDEYYDDLTGAGPHYYFFETAGSMKIYFYADAFPARGFLTYAYSYMESANWVVANESTKLQILSVDKDILKAVEYMAVRAGGEKVYGYSVYKRMSKQELEECQKAYPTDFSNQKGDNL